MSGRRDLNLRPLAPQASALDQAAPRPDYEYFKEFFFGCPHIKRPLHLKSASLNIIYEMPPVFPNFREIRLEDRDLFLETLRKYRPTTSELTFTNLFIWRDHYKFSWSLLEDTIFVIAEDDEGKKYAFQPLGIKDNEIMRKFISWMAGENEGSPVRFERVDRRFVEFIRGYGAEEIAPLRDHFDYVYLRSELVELRGSKFRQKRQRLRRALEAKNLEFSEIRPEHIDKCLSLHERWCKFKGCDDDRNLKAEFIASIELFRNYSFLGVKGLAILLGGKLVAFSVGEMLNDETVVVHFEKVDPEYPDFYPLINLKFLEICAPQATYVNREQDLGVPGLRASKLSYHPHHLEEKFRVEIPWTL